MNFLRLFENCIHICYEYVLTFNAYVFTRIRTKTIDHFSGHQLDQSLTVTSAPIYTIQIISYPT